MIEIVHCFLSVEGGLLPRWREAFPAAGACRFESLPSMSAAQLIWVRLNKGVASIREFDRVREYAGADVPIVALSDQPDDEEALACFSAGARGYCNSHAVPELLHNVAEVALQGGLWIGESLMRRLLQGTARIRIAVPLPGNVSPDWAALLTDRELQVALAVAQGASNKEVARLLNITERTVKAHIGAIFAKLNVRDRLQLSLIVHGRPLH